MQEEEPSEPMLVYVHTGTLGLQSAGGMPIKAEVQVASSLMYPYVAPVLSITSASASADGKRPLPAVAVAAAEAEVNVTVAAEARDDPLPAQLARLCELLAEAADRVHAGF
jgi:hypothetical protein